MEEPLVLDSGVTLKPVSLWSGSTNVHRVVWDPRSMGPPAYKVRIGEGGEPVWISRELGVAAAMDGRTLARISNAFSLGFAVTLDDAVAEYWPASSIPRAFYSIVKVAYPPDSSPRPDRIETNAPLLCNGFRLYQSDIDKKAPYRYSVFSVARDPGVPWVTAGFVLMTLGFLWLYMTRFILKPIRLRRAEKGEAA
jgi:cytochrome c biogenesis protein ResB